MAGGIVERNPHGHEAVVARKIVLNSVSEKHPMMDRQDGTFDAVSDHTDHISRLPDDALRAFLTTSTIPVPVLLLSIVWY
jgi:hypothetical protein